MARFLAGAVAAVFVLVFCVGFGCSFFSVMTGLAKQGALIELFLVSLGGIATFLLICLPTFAMLQLAQGQAIEPTLVSLGRALGAIFESGAFYFFVGIAFLATAFLCQRAEVNSTLTFIVALLGIAILLYGTGSQATLGMGQGQITKLDPEKVEAFLKEKLREPDKSPEVSKDLIRFTGQSGAAAAYVNFAVAGGAAALTAFFGWGITSRAPEIQNAFSRSYEVRAGQN
jgi:hypothetical protein